MELTLQFRRPPPLLCFTAEEPGGTASFFTKKLSLPPLFPLLPPPMEEKSKSLVTTTLTSLGSWIPLSIMPNPSPKKPNRDNSCTDSVNSSSESTIHSVITQEDKQVNIDKKSTADSRRRCFKLFGVSMDYPPDSDQVDVKKRKMDDGEELLLGQEEESDKLLPIKKRACFRGDFVYLRCREEKAGSS